jgi:hypothetical protein
MAKFLTESDLNAALERIFRDARESLVIVSPYIRLHDRIKDLLKEIKDDPQIKITLLFGKNEADITKSFYIDDIRFFMEFPNIQIRHNKRLHAKFYANESQSLLTSLNLYDYSQNNNIEAGVLSEVSLKNSALNMVGGGSNLDNESIRYFLNVFERSELLFHREAQFKKAMLGITTSYEDSIIRANHLSGKLEPTTQYRGQTEQALGYASEAKSRNTQPKQSTPAIQTGYCIRTGSTIPFNPQKPMSDEAYKNWSNFSNPDYPEKYCHYSGEPSNGETTFKKPILRKNWAKSQKK